MKQGTQSVPGGGAPVDSDQQRAAELRDARIVAGTFLSLYPRCFHLLGADVVVLMVEGFVLRRVLVSMSERIHMASDVPTIRRFVADVFNAANHLSFGEQDQKRSG